MGTNSTGCAEWERDFDPETEQPMDAPTCKICGQKHWSRLCNPVTKGEARNATVADVTLQRNATPKLVAPSELRAAKVEVEALRAEVVQLKRELAEAGTKATACPECERRRAQVAERVRKSRGKAK
jgi:hypothetical protein